MLRNFVERLWSSYLEKIDWDRVPIVWPVVAILVILHRILILAQTLSAEHDRIKKRQNKRSNNWEAYHTKKLLLSKLKQAKFNLEAEKHTTKYQRALWHVVPLLIMTVYSVKIELKIPDSPFAHIFTPETFESKLSRTDHNWRNHLKWPKKLENGAYKFQNGTLVFENGTRIFYNNTILHPDGTLVHTQNITYFDVAETRSYLVSDDLKDQHCGLKSDIDFSSWGCADSVDGKCKTTTPVLLPLNDEELRKYLRIISDNQCVIRPLGSRQSMGGLVAHHLEAYTVAVSLAKYIPTDENWRLHDSLLLKSRVRVPAGQTLLDLYSVIRPKGYFLPSHTSNWALSIGSVAANMIYGGGFGEGALNSYITALRVMFANGTIAEITDEKELSCWRGSMGLLGIITAAEFMIEKRSNFIMGSRSSVLSHWNKWVLDEVVADLLPGTKGAHYLFDPWLDELLGIGYVDAKAKTRNGGRLPTDNTECVFSPISMSCVDADFCHFSPHIGDFLPSHFCRLKTHFQKNYNHGTTKACYEGISKRYREGLALNGMPEVEETVAQFHSKVKITGAWLSKSLSSSKRNHSLTTEAQDMLYFAKGATNDGFWQLGSKPMATMSYCFPVECLYDALDVYRQLVRDLVKSDSDYNLLDAPLMFSFFKIYPSKIVLQPKGLDDGNGHYVNIVIQAGMKSGGKWTNALAQLEQRWLSLQCTNGIVFPVTTSLFAFSQAHAGTNTDAKNYVDTAEVDHPEDTNGQSESEFHPEDDDDFDDYPYPDRVSPTSLNYHPNRFMVDNENLSYPFSNKTILRSVFPLETQARFLNYRKYVDPENHFWGGRAIRLFDKRLMKSMIHNQRSSYSKSAFATSFQALVFTVVITYLLK